MQDKSLEVLDHAAGVADDLIARALVIVKQVQAGEKKPAVPCFGCRSYGRRFQTA